METRTMKYRINISFLIIILEYIKCSSNFKFIIQNSLSIFYGKKNLAF